jgi:membrane protease subunit HflC
MNRSGTRIVAWGLVLLLVLGYPAARGIFFTVDERELAVVLQFGRPVAAYTEPGLRMKVPFIQEVRRFPRTRQLWSGTRSELLVDLPTKDGNKIEVSAWAVWRITDPEQFVQVLVTLENGETAVKTRVRAAVRDVITDENLAEVVRSTDRKLTYTFKLPESAALSGATPLAESFREVQTPVTHGRDKIMDRVKAEVARRLITMDDGNSAGRGIEMVDVGISRIEFVPEVQQKAFLRQIAFMESIANGYRADGENRKQQILNETRAEVEKIQGEGTRQASILKGEVDAEIIEKYAAAIEDTGDFFQFVRTLEVYKKALSGDTRLILTTDSELLKLLKGMEPASAGPPRGAQRTSGP